MKMVLISGVVLAGAFCAGPALAADLARPLASPAKAPAAVPNPVFSWTGFYIGGNAGYAWGSGKGAADSYGLSPDGFFGGGQLGYNYQFQNNVLVGIETDIQGGDISGGGNGLTSKLDYFGTVRARLGYAMDRFLPYVTGGLAYGKLNVNDFGYSDSNSSAGWTAGAGLEYAITNNWTARAEYLYVDLGTKTFDNIGAEVGAAASTARLGVNYKF